MGRIPLPPATPINMALLLQDGHGQPISMAGGQWPTAPLALSFQGQWYAEVLPSQGSHKQPHYEDL